MTSRQTKQQEDNFFRILHILNEQPTITQRDLAEKLGVSVGGLNYCLKSLVEKGLVKIQNFGSSKNKLRYIYLLTPAGVMEKTALAARFLRRKMLEYESLKQEIEDVKKQVKSNGIKLN